MKIEEASKDITRLRNSITSFKTSYMKENTQKMKKQTIKREKLYSCIPGLEPCSLGCFPRAPRHIRKHLCTLSVVCVPHGVLFREIIAFCYFYVDKTQFLSLNRGGNKTYKYKSSYSYFSFITKWFKRKASTRSFKGGISLFTLSL